jgi:hypothetical protein
MEISSGIDSTMLIKLLSSRLAANEMVIDQASMLEVSTLFVQHFN